VRVTLAEEVLRLQHEALDVFEARLLSAECPHCHRNIDLATKSRDIIGTPDFQQIAECDGGNS